MMSVTHRPMASAWWLGTVLAANAMGAGIHPVTAIAGAAIAPAFGAGDLSPDGDVTWLKFLGHRQATHRPDTTALILTALTAAGWVTMLTLDGVGAKWAVLVPAVFAAGQVAHRLGRSRWSLAAGGVVFVVLVSLGLGQVAWLAWAPVTGWWSHLVGDAAFGKIPVGAFVGRILAAVLPERWVRKGGGRQPYWVGLGLDTDGLLERGNRRLETRTATGLHQTKRVLWFAPTTVFLTAATAVLTVAVTWQWAGLA